MKTKWLFPNRYRLTGWFIFVPSFILGLVTLYAGFSVSCLVATVLNKSFTIDMSASQTNSVEIQNLTDELARCDCRPITHCFLARKN